MATKLPRIGVAVTEELDEILNKIAAQERRPKSEIVRWLIEEYAREKGYEIGDRVQWGGNRHEKGGQ